MPPSSYLTMSSFSYQKLKKLPPPTTHQDQQDQDHSVAIQDYYRQAVAAIVARRRAPWRSSGGGRRRRPRLRISSLTRALRRKAAAAGGRVRASVAKVVGRFKEAGPYVGDLFAGNYMFMQVTPSAPAVAGGMDRGFLPYYYAVKGKGTINPCLAPPRSVA